MRRERIMQKIFTYKGNGIGRKGNSKYKQKLLTNPNLTTDTMHYTFQLFKKQKPSSIYHA